MAHAFSDPAPPTTVVKGSEKDAIRRPFGSNTNFNRAAQGLKEREDYVLDLCYLHGFVTRQVLERTVLRGISKRGVSRFFDRLISKRALERKNQNWLAGRGVYCLSRSAYSHAKTRFSYDLPHRFNPNPFTFHHDEAVIESSIHLREMLGGTWEPERALKTDQYQEVPDGILRLESGGEIAVEVEFSKKHRIRLKRLLDRWQESEVALVLYLCGDENIARFVESVMSESASSPHLALMTISELRQRKSDVWTPAGLRRLPLRKGSV